MSASSSGGHYLFLLSVGDNTSMLNRQQLLGSMPKVLDALAPDETITIETVEQSLFTQALTELRSKLK
jgi:hypothetical protein